MSGGSDFNEVFFTGVRVSDSHRLGAVGDGWKVALTTLMHERLAVGGKPSHAPGYADADGARRDRSTPTPARRSNSATSASGSPRATSPTRASS